MCLFSRRAGARWRSCGVAATILTAIAPSIMAQQAPQNAHELDEIVVVGVTPVPGFKVDKDKIPGNIQTLRSSDLTRNGAASVLGALDQQVGSVNFNDTLADPYQPGVLFRGFEASPVLGTPQGMAVYQNGVRVNEAFGDTVNWDLIPDIAIDRIDVLNATSVFGLNALGGAMTVTMKNGFSYQGFDATLSGGSFNQRQAQAEYGVNDGTLCGDQRAQARRLAPLRARSSLTVLPRPEFPHRHHHRGLELLARQQPPVRSGRRTRAILGAEFRKRFYRPAKQHQ
jgi:outer membrane cobalamin receptor